MIILRPWEIYDSLVYDTVHALNDMNYNHIASVGISTKYNRVGMNIMFTAISLYRKKSLMQSKGYEVSEIAPSSAYKEIHFRKGNTYKTRALVRAKNEIISILEDHFGCQCLNEKQQLLL